MQIAKSFLKTKKEQRKKSFAMIFRHSKGHGHKDRGTPVWTGRKTEQRISIMTHEEEAPDLAKAEEWTMKVLLG